MKTILHNIFLRIDAFQITMAAFMLLALILVIATLLAIALRPLRKVRLLKPYLRGFSKEYRRNAKFQFSR